MATGANANTWGTNTNNNLEVVDAFSAGYLSKSVAGSANITLTTANASDTAESSNKVIELTGSLTGDIVVFIPAVENNYIFFNNTTGSQTLTIAATGHTANGVQITQGAKTMVYCDGSSDFNVEIAASTDLGSQTGTLPQVSGANLTNLNASNVASGTLPDARFPATLPQISGANLTNLNASNVASGTLANARLDTVPTTKGGTGLTSLGSAGQVIQVNSGGSALEFGTIEGGGGMEGSVFTSPGTWTKDSGLKAVKVTVIGAGGNAADSTQNEPGGSGGGGGGAIEFIQVPSIPGPVSVTVGSAPGGTSSFGAFCSATGGGNGTVGPAEIGGTGGSGSGGSFNSDGSTGEPGVRGGGSAFGYGPTNLKIRNNNPNAGANGQGFGSGGGGGQQGNNPANHPGGDGAGGIVVVEEFY
jgi:hypothetical protein